jgi:hypothetical protein
MLLRFPLLRNFSRQDACAPRQSLIQLSFGGNHLRNVNISIFPDFQKPLVFGPRLLALTFPLIGLSEMIMQQRIIWIEPLDAFVFAEGLI